MASQPDKGPSEPCEAGTAAGTAYTTFTHRQRHLLTLLLGLTAIISPLTATIYFPLLPLLARRLNTSPQAINLTITIYIVFQALSPAIFGALSDALGRRFAFLITLTLFTLSSLGLALTKDNYVALLVLRASQSLGASSAFAIANGVVADVCVPAKRGTMVGLISMALNLGTCIGPIVGGWVAYSSSDYGWVFWFLLIIGVLLLLAVGVFLPETARALVSDGNGRTCWWWERAWALPLLHWAQKSSRNLRGEKSVESAAVDRKGREEITASVADSSALTTRKVKMMNFLDAVRLIFFKDASLTLIVHGLNYMADYSIQAATPSAYETIYRFNELHIGLSYLPRGAGIIVGSYANGKLMDRNYELTAHQIGDTLDTERTGDIAHFPIEKARTRSLLPILSAQMASIVGFGWALHQHVHVSVPLVLQFFQGLLNTAVYTSTNTLLVDVFPKTPSTAAAAASIIRCALAALGTATVDPLVSALGRGWYFTLLGGAVGGASLLAVWTIQTWGMSWRVARMTKGEGQVPRNEEAIP